MQVIISCDHCQKQFEYDYVPVMDSPILGDCSWCGEDVCESCQSQDDQELHKECVEDSEAQESDNN